jgi:hypothetical protein
VAEIRKLLAGGNPVMAIKLYRTYTGAGLAQAKAFIDQLLASGASSAIPSPALLDDAVARLTQNAPPGTSSSGGEDDYSADAPERLAAAALARALLDRAYELCELCHDQRLDYATVLEQLAADCPGFSAGAYEQARGYAMLASR